jgi:DNA-binding PadR family transcriptional regulator
MRRRKRGLSPQATRLLLELAAAPRTWRHGYDLARETGLRSGTLYPLLMRLSDRGLLEAEWRPPDQAGRPARHVYRLAPSGLALARDLAVDQRRPATARPARSAK